VPAAGLALVVRDQRIRRREPRFRRELRDAVREGAVGHDERRPRRGEERAEMRGVRLVVAEGERRRDRRRDGAGEHRAEEAGDERRA
jgi:hypothetical protein